MFEEDVNWTYRVKEGENKSELTVKYTAPFAGWGANVPTIGSASKDVRGMVLDEVEANRIEGGLVEITLKYVSKEPIVDDDPEDPESPAPGTEDGEIQFPGRRKGPPGPKYSAQIAVREEHILTSSFAAPLDDVERTALFAISNGTEADENGQKYEEKVTSALGQQVLAKIRRGNTHYYAPGVTAVQHIFARNYGALNFSSVGKRAAPGGPFGGSSSNWLYMGAEAEPTEEGQMIEIRKHWQFSADGWDSDLYS
jgi:hypothetical protein